MYTRYAIFEGTVPPDREEEFFHLVEDRLLVAAIRVGLAEHEASATIGSGLARISH